MSNGKRFKKKMQNPVAGNSYWRIWGWPIKPENHVHFKDDPDGIIIDGVWVQVFFNTVQGTSRYGRGRDRLSGTVAGYYRTRKQAMRVLQEIKDGKHPNILASMREFHEMMDDLEKCIYGVDDDYMDQDELVEKPVEQVERRALRFPKTLHEHFVGKLQENGMFEKQAEEVMQLYWKSGYASSADLADKPTHGYDEMLFGLLWMGIRAVALEYINTNCPKAWFKAVFDDNDPIHQQLADKKKKESREETDHSEMYRGTNKHGNDQYWIDGKEVCARCNEPYINKVLGVECDQCQKEQHY